MKKRFIVTGVSILCMIAVFTAIYISRHVKEEGEKKKEESKKIFHLTKDQIKSIILREGDDEAVLVERGGRWYMEKPVHAVADDMRLENILNLSEVKYITKIDRPGKKDDFGFGRKGESVTFKGKDGKEYSLFVGGKRPVGGGFFVKTGSDDAIYSIHEDVKTTITAKARDLFERDVVPLYPSDIGGVALVVGGKTYSLVKKDESWYAGDKTVENGPVEGFLRELCYLNAKDILSEGDVKEEKLEVTFTPKQENQQAVKVKFFGTEKGKDAAVTVEGRDEILGIAKTKYENIMKKLESIVNNLVEKTDEEKKNSVK